MSVPNHRKTGHDRSYYHSCVFGVTYTHIKKNIFFILTEWASPARVSERGEKKNEQTMKVADKRCTNSNRRPPHAATPHAATPHAATHGQSMKKKKTRSYRRLVYTTKRKKVFFSSTRKQLRGVSTRWPNYPSSKTVRGLTITDPGIDFPYLSYFSVRNKINKESRSPYDLRTTDIYPKI